MDTELLEAAKAHEERYPKRDLPCLHEGEETGTEALPCCGTVRKFECRVLGHEVLETKCRSCVHYNKGERRTISPHEASIHKRLVLTNGQSPGDILMLTAAVRDLHKAYPGAYETDIRTTCGEIWDNNPYVTRFSEPWIDDEAQVARDRAKGPILRDGVVTIPCGYELSRTHHFVTAMHRTLENALGLTIPPTDLRGEIYLSDAEKRWMSQLQEIGVQEQFWLIGTDGKFDYSCKWPNWRTIQKVIDRFYGKILFVQTGVKGNFNPPLRNVVDLRGQTSLRMLIRLMYHATGVLCSMNGLMHMASAIEPRPGDPARKPCVVLAGGREESTWEHYPWQRWLGTQGTMPCCVERACWKSRCTLLPDGDGKNRDPCVHYTEYDVPHDAETGGMNLPTVRIAKCLDSITDDDIVAAIESYYNGGVLAAS